jgi:hemoglobin
MSKMDNFEARGGRESLEKVCKVFYDKVYAHPWLKLYFEKIPQEHIERQQVNFMQKVLGGFDRYSGKTPPAAHKHMFITEELFQVRQQLLRDSFNESFKPQLVRQDMSQCKPRFEAEGVVAYSKP